MRSAYRKNQLSEKRIQELESIGMVWNIHDRKWEQSYQAAKAYWQEHGDLNVPKDHMTPGGISLRNWLRGVRRAFQEGNLSWDRIEKMRAIDENWDKFVDGTSKQSRKRCADRPKQILNTI